MKKEIIAIIVLLLLSVLVIWGAYKTKKVPPPVESSKSVIQDIQKPTPPVDNETNQNEPTGDYKG